MYELKTKVNNRNVMLYIKSLENKKRQEDSIKLLKLFDKITEEEPKMWGDSIIGYGNIKYTNSQKKEYDWFKVGFSPRKNSLSLYLAAYSDYVYKTAESMKLKHGKGCVYIKDLDKVDLDKLEEMIKYSLKENV